MAKDHEDLAKSPVFLFAYRGRSHRPRATVARHSHAFWQFEWILDGRVSGRIGDQDQLLVVGDGLLIPPGMPHGFTYPDERATWVSVKFAWPGSLTMPADALLPDEPSVQAIAATVAALVPPGGVPAPAARNAIGHCLAGLIAVIRGEDDPHEHPHGMRSRIERLVLRNDARAWTVADIAREMGVSPGHCSSQFRRESGLTLKNYLDQQRALAAQRLLRYGDLDISAVAETTGFPDLFAFSRFFKRMSGCSPRAWRARTIAAGESQIAGVDMPDRLRKRRPR